jgi:predicted enzyme related to lactoylglutathione lyase
MANRVVHFEIHADDVERAAKFYTSVFGWEIKKWEGMEYWMVMTAPMDSKEPGINGGMLPRNKDCAALVPNGALNAFVATVQVEDIDATIIAIEQAGGKLAMPKFDIGGMALQAYYTDTEGNMFGIHQRTGKMAE